MLRTAPALLLAFVLAACSSSTEPGLISDTHSVSGSWVGAPVDGPAIVDSMTVSAAGMSGGWNIFTGSYVEHGGANDAGSVTIQKDPNGPFVDVHFGAHEVQANFTDANTIVGTTTINATVYTYRFNRLQ